MAKHYYLLATLILLGGMFVSLVLGGRPEEARFLVVIAGFLVVLGRLEKIQKRLDER